MSLWSAGPIPPDSGADRVVAATSLVLNFLCLPKLGGPKTCLSVTLETTCENTILGSSGVVRFRNPGMDPDQFPPGQPTPVVTALSQEADDLRAALVADLLRVEQEALLDEVAETLAYLNLELLSTSEAVTHIVAVVDDFRRRCAQILG